MNKYFRILIEAIDSESFFFQNFYPYCNNKNDAIEMVSEYLTILRYTETSIEEIDECENILDIDDLIQINDFVGYIQNIKHAYEKKPYNSSVRGSIPKKQLIYSGITYFDTVKLLLKKSKK